MPHKQVLFRSAAREKLLQGCTQLADAVRITLGPKSKSVLIQKSWGAPLVCNDGVTIARELSLTDAEQNLGVQMLRQAAEKTGEAVGDGTSTATILAQALYQDGLRNVTAGASAIDIKRGMERALDIAVKELARLSRPVRSSKEKAQVATISAHNDAVIGQLVADAMDKVGGDGVITVEESKSIETTLETVEGMQFDRGYLSPYFVTDGDKMQAVLTDAYVLLTDRTLNILKDIVPLLEQVAKSGKSILFIADDIAGEALATLILNRMRGVLHSVAVKAPGFGDRRKAMLEDMAILTGGQVISTDLGMKLEDITLDQLGHADRVVVERETTTLIGGGGDAKAIQTRIQQLRREHDESKSDYDREKLQERIARLSGGVAVVRVGAPSESEMKSRKDALDDAISATKAAVAEGIVAGGGQALIKVAKAVAAQEASADGDERTGMQILRQALAAPARQIAENSSVDGGVVVSKMQEGADNVGFDAARKLYVDLFEAGIVDPAKVVRVALQNAVSVASVLLLTEATLTEIPEPDKNMSAPEAV